MSKFSSLFAVFIFCLGVSLPAAAQNRFEGYNIIVDAPETQTQGGLESTATRYVPTTTQINITDLNPGTPMRLQSCDGGNFAPVRQVNATTAAVTANNYDYKWCFAGEDKMYRISFQGDKLTPKLTYNWIANPAERELGFYNVRDFGAKGDGKTDDTVALRSAMAFVAAHNGGRLRFPDGDYVIGNAPEYPNSKGITLPSGVIVEGSSSINTGAAINNVLGRNSCRITLKGQNRAIFRIGEGTERVVVRDLELYAESDQNTYGIEAVGGFVSSQDIFFDRIAFTKFFRGIYAHALPVNNSQWQFDFVKVSGCRFALNRDAGIHMDFWNSDWAIRSSFFVAPNKTANVNANAITIAKVGTVLVEDTFAGSPGGKGGDFINAVEMAQLTVIGSQCESMSRSIVFGEAQGAGNLGFTIMLINNIFGDSLEIKARKTIISTGNTYNTRTFKVLHPDARVYSTGDRFCLDGYTAGCDVPGAASAGFQGGKIIFATGQPSEGSVPGRPTVFGHDVQFNSPIQLPNLTLNAFPTANVGSGSFVYCTNCRRSTAPCQAGGTGAPAMFVGNRWECL